MIGIVSPLDTLCEPAPFQKFYSTPFNGIYDMFNNSFADSMEREVEKKRIVFICVIFGKSMRAAYLPLFFRSAWEANPDIFFLIVGWPAPSPQFQCHLMFHLLVVATARFVHMVRFSLQVVVLTLC